MKLRRSIECQAGAKSRMPRSASSPRDTSRASCFAKNPKFCTGPTWRARVSCQCVLSRPFNVLPGRPAGPTVGPAVRHTVSVRSANGANASSVPSTSRGMS